MEKVRIERGEICWPRHCAVCLELPQKSVKSSCTILTKMMPFIHFIPIAGHHMSIKYPVCLRHFRHARLIAFVTNRNPLNLGVLVIVSGWLLISILFFVALSFGPGTNNDATFFLISMVTPAAMIMLYTWSRRRVPVRINDVDEKMLTITFANSDYGRLFRLENQRLIH